MEVENRNKYKILIYMIKREWTEEQKGSKHIHCPHMCSNETAAEPRAETAMLSQWVALCQAQTFKGICPQ